MTNLKEITEYIQCKKCKEYVTIKDVVKVKAKQSLIDKFRNEEKYDLICKGCVNK